MVNKINIGIVGIQGAISEHKRLLDDIYKKNNISGKIFFIKKIEDLENINGLILPGGESTVISNFLEKTGLIKSIYKKIKENEIFAMGTCAGCVILSSKISNTHKKSDIKLLKLLDIEVERNAFGNQKESFEKKVFIKNFKKPFNAVFIRAPIIRKTWNNVEVLAKTGEKIIMVKQNNLLALSFHPELTDDLRIHEYFIDMIKK